MKPFKTKSALRSAIYKLVGPLAKGFFDDSSWENVNRIWEALKAEGIAVGITNAAYRGMESKTWDFVLEFAGHSLTGQLIACFCGSKEDPTGRYDICFIV